ncbi:chain length determinant protein EpsF [Marinobacter fonticola]|uniref:chain length determinant protein EpsF n=1 Tax=Marinobacter fonticola TaxID=2603215 RepID=UPI0011E79B0B|nr:chain length determinant protein EpsF [Marinobacter fonticola]
MTFDTFFRVLLARWKLIIVCFLLCVGAALAVSLVLPKSYTASTELIVDDKTQDPLSGTYLPSDKGYLATQVDVITSRNVALRVWAMLNGEQQSLAKQQFSAEDIESKEPQILLARYILQNINASPGRDSDVVRISMKSENPQLAAILADAVAGSYVQTSLELRTEPARRFTEWYDGQLEVLRANLREARETLSSYQKKQGIVAVDERLDVESSRLRELSSMLVEAQGQRLQAEARKSSSKDENWRQSSADVLDNPVLQGLRSELATAEANLQELSTRLGENHPRYLQARAEVLTLRSRIAEETTVVGSSIQSAAQLSTNREKELARAVDEQKNQVLELTSQRDELKYLQQEVAMAQEAYNSAANRASASRLESRLAETDIAVLNPAITPSLPSGPNLKLNLVIAAALGVLLGIGLALMLELFNRRVRSRVDLEETLGLPVLAYLPHDRRRWI